jgi:hypothetical protein
MTMERIKLKQNSKEEMEKVENWLADLAEWYKKGLELMYLDEERFYTCCSVNDGGVHLMEPRAVAELLGFSYEVEMFNSESYELEISFMYAGVKFCGLE